MRAFPLALLAAWLLIFPAPPVRAQDSTTPANLDEAVRKAITAKQLEDSDNINPAVAGRASYREVSSEGGVLVGLEVGLSKLSDKEIPYAIRPVYRVGGRDHVGSAVGNFSSPKVIRTVRVTAKDGYAVGGIWQRSGAGMDRLALLYMRVRDGHLDPTDTYSSEWVGTSNGGSQSYTDGKGKPIVGLFADGNREQARGIGFVYAKVPVARPVAKDAEPVPAAEQPARTPDADEAAAAGGRKSKLQEEAEAHKAQAPEKFNPIWLIVIFGVVMVPLVVVAVLVLGRKGESPEPESDERAVPPDPRRPSQPRPARPELPAGQPLTERPALAARLEGYTHAPTPAAVAAGGAAPEPPPYFLVRATSRARADRMTRIYVHSTELLVIDAGPGADCNKTAGFVAAAATGGGLLGALIGGAVGKAVADGQKDRGRAIQDGLDRLDLPTLQEWATTEVGNFRARLDEVLGIEIDPPLPATWWRGKSPALATFRFRHAKRGEFTFDFLTGVELRGAVEMLRSVFGDRLRIGGGWDDATAPFLGRM
jgi:hypothetical protein